MHCHSQEALEAAALTHQDMGSSEEVAEWVIQQVDERRCIEISVTHHLTGKECLPGATAKQASHHPIAHIHVMSYFLKQKRWLDHFSIY